MSAASFRVGCSIALVLFQTALLSAQLTPASTVADDAGCRKTYAAKEFQAAANCFAVIAARKADQPEEASGALLMEAKSLLHANQPDRAEAALRAAVNAAPQTAESLYLLGLLLEERNQPKESLEIYTRAAALQPPNGEQLRIVARDYVLLDSYKEAAHWLQKAVAFSPGNAEAWYDLGRVHMHDGRYPDAVTALRKSLAIQPSAKAEDNLGICLEAENQSDAALSAYAKAVTLADAEPHPSEQPFVDYGKLLDHRNEFSTALPLLKRAADLNPKSSAAFAELSRAYSGAGQTDAARSAMETAVRLDSGNSRLHFQLGRLYRASGRTAEAQREFELSSKLYGEKSAE
ncbi:tetratricopeptide repeat protein [Terriglobus aquaticus]|uniref:Tetratricopeptide repeat protein n=1 Tax=Terriglobus aquaticus TaxID=940139 RepID=A0ABW9KLB5_9BACT|nr:tetratricopeptide repeat protein [Terriglobus aquaticus]